jgi:NO-binding membrane sensor protein with MHYT domain
MSGGVLMAVGIGTMHYTGMAAMRLQAMHHYDTTLVIGSIAIAAVICVAALGLAFQFRDEKSSFSLQMTAAVLMGLAIPVMHYTAMAAVSYTGTSEKPDLSFAADVSMLAIAGIVLVTFLLLSAVLIARRTMIIPSKSMPSQPLVAAKRTGA